MRFLCCSPVCVIGYSIDIFSSSSFFFKWKNVVKTNDVPSVERPDEKSVVSQLRYSLQKITADVVVLHSTKERER
jgi:hypothetical protein